MITIPFYVILLTYLGFIAICAIFLLINLVHLFHTGTLTLSSLVVTAIVFGSALVILSTTWNLLPPIPYGEPIVIWKSGSLTTIPGL